MTGIRGNEMGMKPPRTRFIISNESNNATTNELSNNPLITKENTLLMMMCIIVVICVVFRIVQLRKRFIHDETGCYNV